MSFFPGLKIICRYYAAHKFYNQEKNFTVYFFLITEVENTVYNKNKIFIKKSANIMIILLFLE